jgi:hypothetical protein
MVHHQHNECSTLWCDRAWVRREGEKKTSVTQLTGQMVWPVFTFPVTAFTGTCRRSAVSSRCTVHKRRKTIVVFALLGLAIAALSYAYAAVYDYTKPTNGLDVAVQVISLILCPAQLFFAFCIDCQVIGRDGLVMYSIIGVLNTAIYTLVGFLVVALREKPNSPNGEQEPPTRISRI